jgi:hypothetical protein
MIMIINNWSGQKNWTITQNPINYDFLYCDKMIVFFWEDHVLPTHTAILCEKEEVFIY